MARVRVSAGLGLGIDNVEHDLDVAEGEALALTGPDPWARPLLRRIAGLDHSPGKVLFDDLEVTSVSPELRGVSMVFPTGALYAHLSVRDNITFGLRARRTSAADVKERLAQVASAMRIELILARNIQGLTAAERTRVAIARALVRHPVVLLLDEPLAGVSGDARRELRRDLHRAIRQMGVTTLLSTADFDDALALGHRVAYVEGSLLRQIGPPLELYEKPADRRIAARAGTPPMSLLTLPVQNGYIRLGGAMMPVPPADNVVLGVRTEALSMDLVASQVVPMLGLVTFVEVRGNRTVCELEFPEGHVTFVCDSRRAPAERTELVVYADLTQLRLFSADMFGVSIPWDFAAAMPPATAPVPAPAPVVPPSTWPPAVSPGAEQRSTGEPRSTDPIAAKIVPRESQALSSDEPMPGTHPAPAAA